MENKRSECVTDLYAGLTYINDQCAEWTRLSPPPPPPTQNEERKKQKWAHDSTVISTNFATLSLE